MSNVVQFPRCPRVEIHYGELISAWMIGATGKMSLPVEVGSKRFFVEAVEADGNRIGMWDGASYEDAIREAHDLEADFGPVHDLVLGGSA